MNIQELFDTTFVALMRQGERAGIERDEEVEHETYTKTFKCLYRAPNGAKCAMGHLIPDEAYDPTMENQGAYGVIDAYPKLPSWMREEATRRFISELQSIHDGYDPKYNDETFREYLQRKYLELGINYDLDTFIITKGRD